MSKRLPFVMLCFSIFVSVTGNALADLAIPWFVLQTTGSASQTGIAAFFAIVPIVLGTFFGGVMVDRIGYKRMSLISDFLSGGAILIIPLLHFTVGISFWQLILLVFLGNLFDAPGRTARSAMLPEIAQSAGISLDRASGIFDMVNRGTILLGAPLAGLLVSQFGAPTVLLLDAVTFGISMLGIGLFIPAVTQAEPNTQSIKQDFIEGFRFIRADGLLLAIIGTIMITNMVDGAMFSVTMPVYADELWGAENGATQLGLLLGGFASMAIIGTLLVGVTAERFTRRNIFIVCFTITALYPLIFATYLPYPLLLLALIPCGIATGYLNPILRVVIYNRVPKTMRGRVLGFTSSSVQVAMPLGVLAAGFLLEIFGLRNVLVAFGLIYVGTVVLMVTYPALHEMNTSPELPTSAETV